MDEPSRLPAAPHQVLVRAVRSGYVTDVNAAHVGRATMLLGAGRNRLEDTINPAVGVVIKALYGEKVAAGEPLVEVHYRTTENLDQALLLLQAACQIGDAPPMAQPLVLATLEG